MTQKVKSKKPPMTVEQANAINQGGGNLVAAAARKKAAHEAMIAEVCQQLGIADHLEAVRALPVEDKKAMLLQLNFAGLSIADGSRVLGVGLTTANRWFHDNPEEMQKLVRASLAAESVKEVGTTWARLQQLRFSENAETSRKASLDVLAVAGMNPHAPAGVTVNVNARNVQFAAMPLVELETQLRELAKAVGPTAEKIVDAELISVKDFHGNAARKAVAAQHVPGADAGADQGHPGGAPPQESKPAD